MKERWKEVPNGYTDYAISSHGRTMRTKGGKGATTGHILMPAVMSDGYLRLSLRKDGKAKSFLVHQLVALTFIPNPNGYKEVNHKNGDKTDNRDSNLEWSTRGYQIHHSYKNGLRPIDRPADRMSTPNRWNATSLEGEIWADIEKCKGTYQVSNFGRIKSLFRMIKRSNGTMSPCYEKILKPVPSSGNRGTYLFIGLMTTSGKREIFNIAKLVLETFTPNPENKPIPNHKNGNTQDNRLINLEWVTYSENLKHAYDTGLRKTKKGGEHHLAKPVYQFSLTGELIKKWSNWEPAGKKINRAHTTIRKAISRKTPCAGFFWSYDPEFADVHIQNYFANKSHRLNAGESL